MTTTWTLLLARQQGLATRAQLRAAGLSRRGLDRELAGGGLGRLAPGLYAAGPLPARGEHLLSGGTVDAGFAAQVRRAVLQLPGARAARRTAAVLWGFDMVVEPDAVELDVPHGHRPPPLDGVQCRQSRSGATSLLVPVPGCLPLPATSAVETVLDCAEELPLAHAVAIADSALRRGAVTRQQLRRAVSARRGRPFCGRLWRVVRWCDPRSGSVLESLLRVVLCEAGLRPPRTQHRVLDPAGLLVGRVDLAWPLQRLVVEADGRRWHDPRDARDADRHRDNGCARAGWLVLRFTWADVVHDPERVVAAVREALASRAGTGPVHGGTSEAGGTSPVAAVPRVLGRTGLVPGQDRWAAPVPSTAAAP